MKNFKEIMEKAKVVGADMAQKLGTAKKKVINAADPTKIMGEGINATPNLMGDKKFKNPADLMKIDNEKFENKLKELL